MRVTIVLDTGGFFPRQDRTQNHVDVGYFETPGPNDIEVTEDGRRVKSTTSRKLGKGIKLGKAKKSGKGKSLEKDDLRIIEVQHLKKDGTANEKVNRSPWFELDLLKKDDLYPDDQRPDFDATAYDCILRFHSGDFHSADVRARRFTEHWLSNGKPTGKDKPTRAIANEIHVEYYIADGEVLRLRSPEETDIWSSSSIRNGVARVVVKILAHQDLNSSYHKKALSHKGQYYYLPNSDPPPMNGNNGGLSP